MNSFLNLPQGSQSSGFLPQGSALRQGTAPSSPNGSGLLGFASPNTGMGNMPPLTPPPRPMVGTFGQQPQGVGNIGGMFGGAAQQSKPQGMAGGIGAIFSQLHPEAQQALRGIPPQHLQALHAAGLIHPQLMGHLMGGNRGLV